MAPLRMFLLAGVVGMAPAVELSAVVAQARREEAAQDPRWRALLHYAPSWRGERSVVDDKAFFVAPTGAWDPQAELEAGLTALLTQAPADQIPYIERFPARSRFLCERFALPRSVLPVQRAVACEDALASFRPRSATLVFASGYLGAPASMFGHTLPSARRYPVWRVSGSVMGARP